MTRSLALGSAIASVLALLGACTSETEPGDTPLPGGGSAGTSAQSGGTSSGTTSTGTSGSGGASSGGTGASTAGTGFGGTAAGTSSTAGSAGTATAGNGGSGGAPSGTPYAGPFTCSMYIGAYLSMEWWNAGFEDKVSNDKWQLKWHHHGYVTEWRKADSPFWADTGDPNNDAQGSPIQSKCATNSDKPDRIVFLVIDWDIETEEVWVAGLKEVVANVKAKYPSVKRLDLMTMVRCPNNTMCNPNADYGPGANPVAGRQDCYVPPEEDAAIAKVIAEDPSFVAAGPKPQMAECNPSHDGAHMTGAGNQQAAVDIGAFYAAQP